MQAGALLSLLQLASPSLPVGAYSYSQGLESAIERGLVRDAASAQAWIADQLQLAVAPCEAAVCWRLLQAFERRDRAAVRYWTDWLCAARDTAEFRAETIQMGYSLAKLIKDLGIATPELLELLYQRSELPFATAWACACVALQLPLQHSLLAMLYAWVENQVLVCVKSVPLGQVAGQRLLLALQPQVAEAAELACSLADDQLSNWTPGLSMLSMLHEQQYSRLYRS